MAINERVSIVLGDDKMFGIAVIDAIVTKESFEDGKKSISVSPISPIKTPYNFGTDPKQELEFSRYKQDCRKRALELAEKSLGESRKNGTFDAGMKDKEGKTLVKEVAEDIFLITLADKYYNWLISIPNDK